MYDESIYVDPLDKETDFAVYEYVLFELDLLLCFGNINNDHKLYNILYKMIKLNYLVVDI